MWSWQLVCPEVLALSPLPGSPSGTTNTTTALPGFWCANTGHIGAYIPFAYINDGICDYELCCDGSDEYAGKGGVKCENRCAAIGKEHRRVTEERKQGLERALKRRRTLAKEARELRRQVEARVTKLKGEVVELEQKRTQLERELTEAERTERGKVVKKGKGKSGGKLSILVGLAKKRVDELRDTLDKLLDHRDDLQDKVTELESILRNLQADYNPNFNDEGVKAAVHSWEDYAAKSSTEKEPKVHDIDIYEVLKEDSEDRGINWKEFEAEDDTDTDILYSFDAYLPQGVRTYIHETITSLRIWMIENGMLADNSDANESSTVKNARSAFQAAENELSSRKRTLSENEEDLSKDYSADDILRALKDKCVSTDAGEYEYEFCWLGQAKQKSKKGHASTGMGNYERFEIEIADDAERLDGKSLGSGSRMVLKYENGQNCWNGPNRRTDIWLGCAEKEEMWRIAESEKCVYKMEVGTPIACEEIKEEGAAEAGKEEL
ncbi:protein kinase c [Grosmannia clavigera kw1407]|uniref:Glucosidase 2 subunit beta n=1 Tax=Grosmannia clavigera (strain kw1407 / UAMH 11150) TaxID=655863 RepID=F0XP75_GROCL|nr:protein kinase c [Grosmannia clavigera kw1407]EFX00251.1 protein kinase c [Grosmannia clavigera kw1407]